MRDMHPEDIKAAIRKKGMTLTALAEANGMRKQGLALALQARVSERAEQVIAEFLGLAPASIWPSRYDGEGNRHVLRRPRVASSAKAGR